MKQFPNNIKYKKYQKNKNNFLFLFEKKLFLPSNGQYGIQSIDSGKIKFKHIEACRKTLKRGLKKLGYLWIKLFTNIPIFKKSLASRMGKGKGNLVYWVDIIKKGQILFEIGGIDLSKVNFILNKSKSKLPFKTKIIKIIY